jgi:hypothetical protein
MTKALLILLAFGLCAPAAARSKSPPPRAMT